MHCTIPKPKGSLPPLSFQLDAYISDSSTPPAGGTSGFASKTRVVVGQRRNALNRDRAVQCCSLVARWSSCCRTSVTASPGSQGCPGRSAASSATAGVQPLAHPLCCVCFILRFALCSACLCVAFHRCPLTRVLSAHHARGAVQAARRSQRRRRREAPC